LTGLYRAITVAALEANLDLENEVGLLEHLHANQIRLEPLAEGNRVWFGTREITDEAHSSEVDANVSKVASHVQVRAWVNTEIRKLLKPFVAEGRDMGAVVFRDTPEDLETVEVALRTRDELDAVNSAAAPDAFMLDTGNLTLEQVVEAVLERVQQQAMSAV
jgi:CMP/dCMP kinase